MSLMISISGVRGIVGPSLTPDVITRYAAAFGEYCGGQPVVVGRDGRITGEPIADLVIGALRMTGNDVHDIGVTPTPTVQICVEEYKAAGGISITASHNPIEWNGLKFLSSTGLFLDAEVNKRLWKIAAKERRYKPWQAMGKHFRKTDAIDLHIQKILQLPYLNIPALRKRNFKVALDAVNAAGGIIGPRLLKALGCSVVEIACDVSGVFSHTPEPLPENLTALREATARNGADIGIAVDPDVDRLALITEKGEPFIEEYTVAQAVKYVLSHPRNRGTRQKVVVNLSTTRAVDDICASLGAEVVRTPVGEINVATKMRDIGAIVGGEGSGGVILPEIHIGRDAPIGIALTLQHLLESGLTASALKASLPQYSIVKDKVEFHQGSPDEVLAEIARENKGKARIRTDDGVKLDFPSHWVHLRKSNTEPIVRIITEATAEPEAARITAEFKARIQKALGTA